jgi:aspartyl-tRNA(Asn)/glutamyl-tRNA(Gln) amidotransferase subunit A
MHKTIAELSRDLQAKKISSVELTQYYLDRIARFDKSLNSFITVSAEEALADAKAADEKIAAGKSGPMTGVPIAQKDILKKPTPLCWVKPIWMNSQWVHPTKRVSMVR